MPDLPQSQCHDYRVTTQISLEKWLTITCNTLRNLKGQCNSPHSHWVSSEECRPGATCVDTAATLTSRGPSDPVQSRRLRWREESGGRPNPSAETNAAGAKTGAARSFIDTPSKLQHSSKHMFQHEGTHDTHNNTFSNYVPTGVTSTPGKAVTVASAT